MMACALCLNKQKFWNCSDKPVKYWFPGCEMLCVKDDFFLLRSESKKKLLKLSSHLEWNHTMQSLVLPVDKYPSFKQQVSTLWKKIWGRKNELLSPVYICHCWLALKKCIIRVWQSVSSSCRGFTAPSKGRKAWNVFCFIKGLSLVISCNIMKAPRINQCYLL